MQAENSRSGCIPTVRDGYKDMTLKEKNNLRSKCAKIGNGGGGTDPRILGVLSRIDVTPPMILPPLRIFVNPYHHPRAIPTAAIA